MIKLFVVDVDGTLTDGGMYFDSAGNEFKRISIKDEIGIRMLQEKGMQIVLLTEQKSECIEKLGKRMGVNYIACEVGEKATCLRRYMEEHLVYPEETAYIGDDIDDMECMKIALNTACPNNANGKIKGVVNAICDSIGGDGAIREFADYILEQFLYLETLEDEKEAWYAKNRLRAHAGGAINGIAYTNSKKPVESTYERGIRVVEVDATITRDGKAVISHNFMPDVMPDGMGMPTYDEFINCKICNRFTPMSLEDLMNYMKQHEDLYVVLDHPAKGFEQLVKIVTEMLNILERNERLKSVLDQFIVQVFSIMEHQWISSLGLFKNLEFYFSPRRDIEGTIEYAVKQKVHTVSINKVRLNKELVSKFKRLGIRAFSPSINSKEEVCAAFEMGLWGVTSDFLDNEQLQKDFDGDGVI